MQLSDCILRIREYLHDPEGKVWNDGELAAMLDAAAAAYSADTGLYRGRFSPMTDADGTCRLPEDYIAFVAGWNMREGAIRNVATDELSRVYGNYLDMTGAPQFISEDTEDIGRVRLCPNPNADQHYDVFHPWFRYGTAMLPKYGIPLRAKGYGLPLRITRYVRCADIAYVRREKPEKIADHAALIYHAVYQAYTMDSDFQDIEAGKIFLAHYKKRIARIWQITRDPASIPVRGKYF